eukprot:10510037-Alexandrium_andersonii.AAC.1
MITFDGGSRDSPHGRASGAAAVLWPPPDVSGSRHPIRSAAVALPSVASSPEAEAWGCRLALELAIGHDPPPARPFSTVGDNLGVVRHAAAVGRLRRAPLCA